jgi:hypothetical protein
VPLGGGPEGGVVRVTLLGKIGPSRAAMSSVVRRAVSDSNITDSLLYVGLLLEALLMARIVHGARREETRQDERDGRDAQEHRL